MQHPEYTPEQIARFWKKVDKSGDCWLWTGSTLDGYGRYTVRRPDGKIETYTTHRIAYALTYGRIPDGLHVLHDCPGGDNPTCCNPAHLWLGTNLENMADMKAKGRSPNTRGEKNGNAKLSDVAVREIRRRRDAGESPAVLMAEFGIAQTVLAGVVRGDLWSHVDEDGAPRTPPGRANEGIRHPDARLTEDAVREIRAMRATGRFSQREIAARFGVKQGTVQAILIGRTWKHV